MGKVFLPHDHGHTPGQLQDWMPSARVFENIGNVFQMLSDGKRVQLFWILCHCEECVINLSALMDMSSSAVSHHLKLLKTGGFVVSRREGKEVYYTAAETARTKALHEMIEEIAELSCPSDEVPIESDKYDTNIQTIQSIHDFLMDHLSERYTIEDLSERFHINQTTLKNTFKTVYGQPLAAYMKARRISHSKDLLLHSSLSIEEISLEAGYQNQSKFTQAFKDLTGQLPREYRKQDERHSFHFKSKARQSPGYHFVKFVQERSIHITGRTPPGLFAPRPCHSPEPSV